MNWWKRLRRQVWEQQVANEMDTARRLHKEGIAAPEPGLEFRDPLLEAMRRVQREVKQGS